LKRADLQEYNLREERRLKMKRLVVVFLLLVFILPLVSCTTINVNTAAGKYAFLMPDKGGVVKDTRSKMVFYILWGLIPLTDNSTKDMINAKEKVRVSSTMGPLDVVISYVLGIVTVQSRTITVEVLK
jgi:hypothetical protein